MFDIADASQHITILSCRADSTQVLLLIRGRGEVSPALCDRRVLSSMRVPNGWHKSRHHTTNKLVTQYHVLHVLLQCIEAGLPVLFRRYQTSQPCLWRSPYPKRGRASEACGDPARRKNARSQRFTSTLAIVQSHMQQPKPRRCSESPLDPAIWTPKRLFRRVSGLPAAWVCVLGSGLAWLGGFLGWLAGWLASALLVVTSDNQPTNRGEKLCKCPD